MLYYHIYKLTHWKIGLSKVRETIQITRFGKNWMYPHIVYFTFQKLPLITHFNWWYGRETGVIFGSLQKKVSTLSWIFEILLIYVTSF